MFFPPFTPLPRAVNIRSVQTSDADHPKRSLSSCDCGAWLLVFDTAAHPFLFEFPSFTYHLSYPPSLAQTFAKSGSRHQQQLRPCHRYYEGSDFSAASPRRRDLPTYLALTSHRSIPNHTHCQCVVYHQTTHIVNFRLRQLPGGSPTVNAESGSSSYRPVFHLQLLPTPPHGQMQLLSVTGLLAYPDTDFHRAVKAPSRAH